MINTEFNGTTIKYSDDIYIECNYDEDYYTYTFDVHHKDGCLHNYCILEQAHQVAMGFLNGKT